MPTKNQSKIHPRIQLQKRNHRWLIPVSIPVQSDGSPSFLFLQFELYQEMKKIRFEFTIQYSVPIHLTPDCFSRSRKLRKNSLYQPIIHMYILSHFITLQQPISSQSRFALTSYIDATRRHDRNRSTDKTNERTGNSLEIFTLYLIQSRNTLLNINSSRLLDVYTSISEMTTYRSKKRARSRCTIPRDSY